MDLDSIVSELNAVIKDLARQDTNEHRCRYFGEARGMIKTLRLLNLQDAEEVMQHRLKVWEAHDHAIKQCLAAGHHIDPHDLDRHQYARRLFAPKETLSE